MMIKAKVIWRFGGKAKLRAEDGRVMLLDQQQINALNRAMRRGDEGQLIQMPDGKVKFRIDADEVDLRPVPTPAIIQTPTDEKSDA